MELWREKKKIRVFVVLLTMTIFVSGNGMTVLAETISENDVWKSKKEAEDSVSVSENNNEEFYTEENGDIIEGSMISVSDNQVGAVAAVPDGTPKNPVNGLNVQAQNFDAGSITNPKHNCTGSEDVNDTTK
ncbi:MAG: hypothetical protein IJN92_02215 [Lachnospiraceae bacterium]|nr:hypothetical protein [Lachnospiraceae bacterium]